MARILGLFPAALIAAKGGMSANAFYREMRDQGLGARRTEVLQLYKIAVGVVSRSPEEPFKNQSLVPTGTEIDDWPTKHATGIAQTVTLAYRDKITGKISQTWFRNVSQTGLTRERVIAMAIDAYSEHAESYNQELIDAVHTSVYRLTPFGG